jgi:hypothetical protein
MVLITPMVMGTFAHLDKQKKGVANSKAFCSEGFFITYIFT